MPIVGTKLHHGKSPRNISLAAFRLALSLFWDVLFHQRPRLADQLRSGESRLRIVQAFGLGFLFVPISLSAYIGIAPEKGNSVSGLINFMRNIGSSA